MSEKIVPLGSYVTIKPIKKEVKSDSGLVALNTGILSRGEVLEAETEGMVPGDVVLYQPARALDYLESFGNRLMLVPWESVVAKVVEKNAEE